MANLDRGAYDSDKLHDFDAEQVEDDSEKSRLPLLVLIALIVLGAFGGVVWLAYTQGVERGRADAPKIIVAQSRHAAPKIAPSPYAGLNIYQPSTTAASGSENADTVPPPPKPLAATHPDNSPPALRPSAAAKQEPPLPAPTVLNSRSIQASAQHPAVQAEAAPAIAPEKTVPAQVPPPPRTTTAADTTSTEAPTTENTVKSGSVLLQIGSYKSDSEAMQSWNAFKSRHSVAAGYRPNIQKVALGAKGTWYRLRLGAFADKQSAIGLCEKLKAQGASCLVAR
jgi:cell division protein FtsN